MVHPGTHVGEFDEVLEVLERRVTPAAVEIANERRSISRNQHGTVTTNDNVSVRVSGVLCVFRRRRRLDDRTAQAAGEADAFSVDIRTGVTQQFQGFGKFPELDTDFLEHGFSIVLDRLERFVVQYVEVGNLPVDIGLGGDGRLKPGSALGLAPCTPTPSPRPAAQK